MIGQNDELSNITRNRLKQGVSDLGVGQACAKMNQFHGGATTENKPIENTNKDEQLVLRLLGVPHALLSALGNRWNALKGSRKRFPFSLLPLRTLGVRLVGESPRADYTLFLLSGLYGRIGFQRGFAKSVKFVLRFNRRDLARRLDELEKGTRLLRQPWLAAARYLLAALRALQLRTPSGVLTNPHRLTLGALTLIAVLAWRFWPRRR